MKIHLNEIPTEGKTWICNRQTSELNAALQDLIGQSPYFAEFTILPMDAGAYEISGTLRTEYQDDCSKCGDALPLKIESKFRDLLMPELDQPRNSHYARSNHVSDLLGGGPEVFNYTGNVFYADEFFHEKLGIEQPSIPLPPCDAMGSCLICKKQMNPSPTIYDEPMETRQKPFEGLKSLKLN